MADRDRTADARNMTESAVKDTAAESRLHEVHVAAAVIVDETGRILLARRTPRAPQGGLWEFPGGKVDPGEDVRQALARELHEELGIEIEAEAGRPLIRIRHRYPDRSVLLDVWRVTGFRGRPHGREGQPLQWVRPDQLDEFRFPAANRPILAAARLPALYAITPEPGDDIAGFIDRITELADAGIRLLQLRTRTLDQRTFIGLARRTLEVCRATDCRLLLNSDPGTVLALNADGVHLTSERLMALEARPLPADKWVAASCHNTAELRHACAIGVDFAVAGPVMPTASHPGAVPLGWEGLHALTERATIPVYALGGMRPADLPECHRHGAQGLAAIRSVWHARDVRGLVKRSEEI